MPGDNGLFVSTGLDKVLKVLLQELRATVHCTYGPLSSHTRGVWLVRERCILVGCH